MPNRPRIDTQGSNWQGWSVRLPLGLFAAILAGAWIGFQLHSQIHDNTSDIIRVEGRHDKAMLRIEKAFKEVKEQLKEKVDKNPCE